MKMIDKFHEFKQLNELFNYGKNGGTIHIHVIPSDIRPLLSKLGTTGTLTFVNEKLNDALQKVCSMAEKDNSIKQVIAVSPDLKIEGVRNLFECFGFKSELVPENSPIRKHFHDEKIKKDKQLYMVKVPIDFLKDIMKNEKNIREAIDSYSPEEPMLTEILRRQILTKYELISKRVGDPDGELLRKLMKNEVAGHLFRKNNIEKSVSDLGKPKHDEHDEI